MRKNNSCTFSFALIGLHVLLGIYSFGGVFSKTAAKSDFLSPTFVVCYGLVLFLLAVYALGWQRVIKYMPLSVAYANKAIAVVWGILWGLVFFGEQITIGKVVGAVIIIAGIALLSFDGKTNPHEQ